MKLVRETLTFDVDGLVKETPPIFERDENGQFYLCSDALRIERTSDGFHVWLEHQGTKVFKVGSTPALLVGESITVAQLASRVRINLTKA